MAASRKPRRPARKRRDPDVKDRLIQTRVPERLEHVLKSEAKKRRLTVSHLIRNVLEDTLELVESVVQGAGDIVDAAGSVADQIRRDAGKVAGSARSVVRPREAGDEARDGAQVPAEKPAEGAQVLAWNRVVVNQAVRCDRCEAQVARGEEGYLGLTATPGGPPVWRCARCVSELSASE